LWQTRISEEIFKPLKKAITSFFIVFIGKFVLNLSFKNAITNCCFSLLPFINALCTKEAGGGHLLAGAISAKSPAGKRHLICCQFLGNLVRTLHKGNAAFQSTEQRDERQAGEIYIDEPGCTG
jgi:hypothetical protein